ncbi:unnamed protein product [Cylicocyclus nassatus]|uniref:Uncharacterized protein n=1 Tax=Cylicocyclus nassatus TaxID=53992 RepID=A0AA36GP50_CYLNA|nr:unnamed protein product [Cylicocyclus nassatus]
MLPSSFLIFVTSLTPVYINALTWTYVESIPNEDQSNASKYQAAIKFVNTADNKDQCDKDTIKFNLGYVTNFAKKDTLCQTTKDYELLCRKMDVFGKNTPWIEKTITTFSSKHKEQKLPACVKRLYKQLEIPPWPKPEGETTIALITTEAKQTSITNATTRPSIKKVSASKSKTTKATHDSGDTKFEGTVPEVSEHDSPDALKSSRLPLIDEHAATEHAQSEGTEQPLAIEGGEAGAHVPKKRKQKQKNTILYVIIMIVLVIMHMVLITLLIFTIRCWRQLRRRENLQSNSRSSHNSTLASAVAPPTPATPATGTRPVPSAQPSAPSLDLWATKK